MLKINNYKIQNNTENVMDKQQNNCLDGRSKMMSKQYCYLLLRWHDISRRTKATTTRTKLISLNCKKWQETGVGSRV